MTNRLIIDSERAEWKIDPKVLVKKASVISTSRLEPRYTKTMPIMTTIVSGRIGPIRQSLLNGRLPISGSSSTWLMSLTNRGSAPFFLPHIKEKTNRKEVAAAKTIPTIWAKKLRISRLFWALIPLLCKEAISSIFSPDSLCFSMTESIVLMTLGTCSWQREKAKS